MILLASLLAVPWQGSPVTTTFSEHIRPIIAEKCVSCHHETGQGPFALRSFSDVRRRGDLVRQVVLTGQMPPTDARSQFGSLTPHQPLTPRELVLVQNWFRNGMPEGAKTQPLSVSQVGGGTVGKVVTYKVGTGSMFPAEGRSLRAVYRVPSEVASRGLASFRFVPDAPKAVRQVVLAVQRRGQPVPFTSAGMRPGTFVASWSQGYNEWTAGPASFTGAGDQLWIQVRGVPTGKREAASGKVIVSHQKGSSTTTRSLGSKSFVVEADTQATLRAEWTLPNDIDLISALPEARYSTELVRLTAKTDGAEKGLVTVLTWDPVWPGAYNFSKPIRLRKGTTLVYEAYINNTKHGHAAEDVPPTNLRFGQKETDELFWCHLIYIDRPKS